MLRRHYAQSVVPLRPARMRDDAAETERQTASEGEDGTDEARDEHLDQIASFAH